jgi:hypothetical protein
MIMHISENFSVGNWSLVAIVGSIIPPRDPNDDDDEDEDDDTESDDDGPAVIREPDEDE